MSGPARGCTSSHHRWGCYSPPKCICCGVALARSCAASSIMKTTVGAFSAAGISRALARESDAAVRPRPLTRRKEQAMKPSTPTTADLKRQAFKQRVLARPVGWAAAAMRLGQRGLWPFLDLVIRVWIAQTFFVSGVLKAAAWDNALFLAANEYPV